MSKRTPGLQRNARDFYPTPEKAVLPLVPHLPVGLKFYEPCVGEGHLVAALEKHAMIDCVGHSDLYFDDAPPKDAAHLKDSDIGDAEMCISNPPWTPKLLHPILDNLVPLRPTWLLLPSDWLFTKQAVPYHRWIRTVVTMPRVIWIPGTTMNGKDNCCWVLFEDGPDWGRFKSGWA